MKKQLTQNNKDSAIPSPSSKESHLNGIYIRIDDINAKLRELTIGIKNKISDIDGNYAAEEQEESSKNIDRGLITSINNKLENTEAWLEELSFCLGRLRDIA